MMDLIGISDAMFWLIIIIALVVIEVSTARMIAVWVAIGALCALAAAVFNLSLPIQVAVFMLASITAIFASRPLVKRILNNERVSLENLIGQVAFVTEDVDNENSTGAVKVGSKFFSAKSENGEIIAAGSQAVVSQIDDNDIYILKI